MSTLRNRFERLGWSVTSEGCWEWSGSRHPSGYGQISGRGTVLKAHRVSFELYVGVIPEGALIRHTCDNPPCVNPEHLLSGTLADNANDAVSRGRAKHQVMTGEQCPASKLDWEKVTAIRESLLPNKDLAIEYGVSLQSIWNIKTWRTWKTQGSITTQ